MGWWGHGDDLMGDAPADYVHELFDALDARLAREGLHRASLRVLARCFAETLKHHPGLLAPRVDPAEAGEALYAALAAICAEKGCEPVERDPDHEARIVAHLVEEGVRKIARTWRDSGAARPPRLSELVAAFAFVCGPDPERYLAVREPVVAHSFHHPLLGVPRATLADLRARCEPDALALLDVAARVARVRTHGAFGARPDGWALRSTDLMRALQLAGQFDALRHPWAPCFAEDTARLRAMCAIDTGAPPDIELDPAWVGHVTAWLRGRPGALDAAGLFGGLDAAALGELLHHEEDFSAGLITRQEGIDRFAAYQEELAGWSAWRVYWPAHLDRGGELAALTALFPPLPLALRAGGAPVVPTRFALLVTDTPGRVPALVQAWKAQLGRLAGLPWDAPRLSSGSHGGWLELSGSPAHRAFRMREYGESPDLEPLAAALRSADTVIVYVQPQYRRALLADVPALADAPTLELAPRRDADLLARWLGVRARAQVVSGERFTLFDLVEAIEAADEEDRWSFDWARLSPWRAIESRRGRLRLELRRFLRSKSPTTLRLFGDTRAFQRFVQTEERLRWLAELDARLP